MRNDTPLLILRPACELLARCAMAWIFVHEAWVKITHFDATHAYMAQANIPNFLLWPALILELFGGLALAAGLASRWAALALATFSVATALIFHLNGRGDQMMHFEKNLAMAGGLVAYGLSRSKK